MKLVDQVVKILSRLRDILPPLIADGNHHQVVIDIKRSKTQIIINKPRKSWDSGEENA